MEKSLKILRNQGPLVLPRSTLCASCDSTSPFSLVLLSQFADIEVKINTSSAKFMNNLFSFDIWNPSDRCTAREGILYLGTLVRY